MAHTHLVFDAINIKDDSPAEYDASIYGYRYKNGIRAESIGGFTDLKNRLESLLCQKPYTIERLARELAFDRQLLQKVLDYLFTHTGEVAALDLPEQSTLYVWSGADVAEKILDQFTLGSVDIDTDDYTPDDVTKIAAYLTNLLALRPSLDVLDDAIDKCRLLLDAARLAQAFQPNTDLENRIVLLKKKHDQLLECREIEVEKWNREEADDEDPFTDDSVVVDTLPDATTKTKRYPFTILYLLGSAHEYHGPERMKYINVDDPELSTFDFSSLRQVVVEMDSFIEDLEKGVSILGIVQTLAGSIFPDTGVDFRFRKMSRTKYKRQVENLLHDEILQIRRHGYMVNTV